MTTEPVTPAELAAACEAWRQMYQAESQLTASLQADCASMSVRIACLLAENESLRLEVNRLHTECGHLQADLRAERD